MNAFVQVDALVKSLGEVKTAITAAVKEALKQVAAYAQEHAKATTTFKDRTGKLRGSIRTGQRGFKSFVRAGNSGAQYAQYVEYGTVAHKIRARRAPFLRFVKDGRLWVLPSVNHPGTKPTRFMASARDAGDGVAQGIFERNLNSAMR